jgi:nitroimidazol reductase NimA-like FMN-containing flavoprotein (pyridoxamine 5'-phosphate oxidase superfamily)
MIDKAVRILSDNRLMSLATVGADGWPQCTMVGYANEATLIYFVISRHGEKYANIGRDDRVSLVVGRDVIDPASILGLSITAHASEITDASQRRRAIALLLERRPGLKRLEPPHPDRSAVMIAKPAVITLLDYSKGFGHSDVLTVESAGEIQHAAVREDDWGYGAQFKPVI